ncbi:MAG: hypothetical protein NTW06_03125 [Candidatus Falkowbacteria bacterium]|nr:hypothetical protein [Candidatus Falkowbacteria bacterium]
MTWEEELSIELSKLNKDLPDEEILKIYKKLNDLLIKKPSMIEEEIEILSSVIKCPKTESELQRNYDQLLEENLHLAGRCAILMQLLPHLDDLIKVLKNLDDLINVLQYSPSNVSHAEMSVFKKEVESVLQGVIATKNRIEMEMAKLNAKYKS